MKNKELKDLAIRIANIETNCTQQNDKQQLEKFSLEIENLIKNLSVEDLFELDEYITQILHSKN